MGFLIYQVLCTKYDILRNKHYVSRVKERYWLGLKAVCHIGELCRKVVVKPE